MGLEVWFCSQLGSSWLTVVTSTSLATSIQFWFLSLHHGQEDGDWHWPWNHLQSLDTLFRVPFFFVFVFVRFFSQIQGFSTFFLNDLPFLPWFSVKSQVASVCGKMTEWKLSPTTRATEPLLPMWPSLTLSDSSVMPPRTKWHVIPRTRLLDCHNRSHLLCIFLWSVDPFLLLFFIVSLQERWWFHIFFFICALGLVDSFLLLFSRTGWPPGGSSQWVSR